jgi:hypothetical protein
MTKHHRGGQGPPQTVVPKKKRRSELCTEASVQKLESRALISYFHGGKKKGKSGIVK